ncbi:MAG: glutamine--tRNA ligase/YqeY domain fusion protein [Holophagales bacterium]|nr:glutamine--tRNA ligase/YqeY domain fusion protein [Holophagales bacterium]
MSTVTPTNEASKENPGDERARTDFVREKIRDDLAAGRYGGVVTRFPPEPNGYLHIGHAKSICLNFGVAEEFGGRCHLRFDDTNPTTESSEYVVAIQRDVRWLGFDWGEHLCFASDYFEKMADLAEDLIRAGKAYVDSSTGEEIREGRGSLTEPGTESPYRGRPVAENLELFRRMRAGELEEGSHVLRAKIDMASPNMLMRDPLLYRIRHAHHHRQGDRWPIYPMYDYAHCLEDAIEGVTHSLCTLEFENNRELYDWVLDHVGYAPPRPEQTEFARLNLGYTLMSKRKLLLLVEEGHVAGWDDPRMPTLSGLRRRGYTPEAIRAFCDRVGVARTHNVIDVALLEYSIRDDLNTRAPRVMAVLDPLRVVIENYPEDRSEELEADYWPHDIPKEGSRKVPFGREILIEREDFAEDPPPGFHRLAPGREVRLRYAYFLRCERVIHDDDGRVVELRCTYDPATRGGQAPAGRRPAGRRPAGTIHWVSAERSLPAEVRLYDRLFATENPAAAGDEFRRHLNPRSLVVRDRARVEPSLAQLAAGSHVQFERLGYFFTDPEESSPRALVFNRTVTLRDTWAKVKHQGDTETKRRAEEKARARAEHKAQQRRLAEQAEAPTLEPEQQAVAEAYVGRGVNERDARLFALDPALAAFFDRASAAHGEPKSVARWLTTELLGRLGERTLAELPFGGGELGELARLVDEGAINNTSGKEVLELLIENGGAPSAIVAERGLTQVSDDGSLEPIVTAVLEASPEQVAEYRGGKTALLGFFIGQTMKASGGKADPKRVRELLLAALGG